MSLKKYYYFDNAATTQKPKEVIDALVYGYNNYTVGTLRSGYDRAEDAYYQFFNVKKTISQLLQILEDDLCFFPTVTLGLNNIINSFCNYNKNKTIKVLLPYNGHNSLIAPWLNNNANGAIEIVWYDSKNIIDTLSNNTFDVVCITSVSHITGELFDISLLQKYTDSIRFLIVDASQQYSFHEIKQLPNFIDCVMWSSHKTYGPHNIAPCFISKKLQTIIEQYPWVGGGTLEDINENSLKIKKFPHSFMYGSLCIPEYYGYGKALEFLKNNVWNRASYKSMINAIISCIIDNNGVLVSHKDSEAIISFYHPKIHAHDIASHLNRYNIEVRSGFLCGDIFFKHYKIPPVVRISLGYFTTQSDVDFLVSTLDTIFKMNQ